MTMQACPYPLCDVVATDLDEHLDQEHDAADMGYARPRRIRTADDATPDDSDARLRADFPASWGPRGEDD